MKTKLGKVFNWIAINAFVSASFYYGITGHNGLAALAQYIMWINGVFIFILMMMYVGDDTPSKERREKLTVDDAFQQAMPNWINITYDLAMAAYLAYNSYVWTALVGLVSYACARILHQQFNQDKEIQKLQTK